MKIDSLDRPARLPVRIASAIMLEINEGRLKAGDRLPTEQFLADSFSVSRNVVREAIRSLVDSNVLEARQGAGVFVASLHVESLIEPLELVLALESATLHSLAEARLAIEPGIAAIAAQRGSQEDIEALEALIEESGASGPEDSERLLEIDVELHNRMVRMTENPFLIRIMDSVGRMARSSRDFTNSVPRMREAAHADHERIVAALSARDADAARRAMADHLGHVASILAVEEIDEAVGEGNNDKRKHPQRQPGGGEVDE